MFPGGLECFQVAWKNSMYPENFPGGKFPGGLEKFHVAWKVFQVAQKLSRWPGKFPGGLECFQVVQEA